MKKNLNKHDKFIRMILAMAISGGIAAQWLSGPFALIGLIVAVYLLGSGFLRWCLIYKIIGFTTEKEEG